MSSLNLRQEKLDEMRQDMLIEYKLREDDDFFYDYLYDKYGDTLSSLVAAIADDCDIYGRNPDDWIEFLLQK